jgi:hypothetical protein
LRNIDSLLYTFFSRSKTLFATFRFLPVFVHQVQP